MQDETSTIPMAPRTRRSAGGQVFVTLLAFLLGAAAVAVLVWQGDLDRFLPRQPIAGSPATSARPSPVPTPATAPIPADALATVGSLETRLAMLEDRFSRLGFEAEAASGNATRAEALLIAFSARRLIDRGEPLGYVADQLRLRFADAQPRAVETIVAFARHPVTIDQLSARLEALAPDLTNTSQDLSLWERLRQEFSGLFVVRRDSSTLLAPAARIQRAKLMLAAGRIGDAVDEVERLPGADRADKWMADAHRYDDVQRALDLVETAAMLEPRRLHDANGHSVDQPSPLAAPAPSENGAVSPPVPTPETMPPPSSSLPQANAPGTSAAGTNPAGADAAGANKTGANSAGPISRGPATPAA